MSLESESARARYRRCGSGLGMRGGSGLGMGGAVKGTKFCASYLKFDIKFIFDKVVDVPALPKPSSTQSDVTE